ncbi:MAG TPA: 3-phosphoglycerate dehydrogenase family protein [Gammaproteobacteria bacterium]|nr:3-phosphoglycerate dehydrogenase family protein [Gammaproteobacteria bacterium]
MFKIKILNTISHAGLNLFPREEYEVDTDIQDPDAILVRSHVMHTMSIPDSVKIIGRAGAGVNNIPVSEFTQRGIPVLNTPGANANAVKELVIAGMLLASRNICQASEYVRQLKNLDEKELDTKIENDKKQFSGFELMGKTLGVIGLGSIGVKVANAALGLGMNIIGYDPTITVGRAWELSSDVKQALSFEHLLRESDFISVHVPLNEDTKNLLGAIQFDLMKNNVVILNFSRDGIIDNAMLLQALQEHKVFSYVSDFPVPHLKDFPRVISLPHLGASTLQAEENCALMIVKQVREFLENGNISHAVNFPNVDMPRATGSIRLSIINENIPNMVAQISSKLAERKINIISLTNKSKDEMAYTLIDVNNDLDNALLNEMTKIKGIVRVRKIGHFEV